MKTNQKTSKGRTPKEFDEKIISIFRRPVLAECYNRLQFRLHKEEDPSEKRAIQKKMDLFSRRIAYIDEVLGRRRK